MKLYCSKEKLSKLMIDEAVKALSEKSVKMTTLERIRLFTYADEHVVPGMPQPLQYGLGLKYVLENISLPIQPYDLILGRISEEVPDQEGEAFFQEVCKRYARDCLPWDKGTAPFWVYDQGHTSFYWRDLIAMGLPGLKNRANAELARRRADGDNQERLDFLQGAVYVYEAIQTYLLRYADAAYDAGLGEAAQTCVHAAMRAPQSFREALQLLFAVIFIYCSMLAGNPTLTFGRLDLFLQDLYDADIASGRMTREEAGLLILDFYSKNNLNMGRGEHQLSIDDSEISTGWQRCLNFDAPQYLYIGGTAWDGTSACTDLTQLFAEQIVPRYKNPVILVRYAKGMMKERPKLWRTLIDKMRQSSSMIVYNEADVINAYLRAGADPEDAFDFEHYGCNWPTIPGCDASFPGPARLWMKHMTPEDWVSLQGRNRLGGIVVRSVLNAVREASHADAQTLDSILAYITRDVRAALLSALEGAKLEREFVLREAPGTLLFMDCFFKDTIRTASSALAGGAKYFTMLFSYGGFATAADSLIAVDKLVFQDHKLTLAELQQALDDNFEHYPEIRAMCKGVPKLGSDDPHANAVAARLLTLLTDESTALQAHIEYDQWPRILLRQSIETDTGHIYMGNVFGATPDGRKQGEPVSQNSQPSVGASINGLTARMMSMASLPFDRIMSGAQNISIQPKSFAGEDGLDTLAGIVGAYFELGGLQTQISAVDVSDLLDAQVNPDAHRDLMVRITGYSAVFVDMTKAAQDDIIHREQMGI